MNKWRTWIVNWTNGKSWASVGNWIELQYKVCTIYLLTCHVAIYLPHGINGMAMTWKLAPSLFLSLSLNCWNKKIASRQRKHAKSLFFSFFFLFLPVQLILNKLINFALLYIKLRGKTRRQEKCLGWWWLGDSLPKREGMLQFEKNILSLVLLLSLARQTNREEEGSPCSSF